MTQSLATIDWHSFLARSPLPSPSKESIDSLSEQPILITGAGGSIGSALALRLAAHGALLILLESSESALYDLQRSFSACDTNERTVFYLGDAGDRALLDEIFVLHRPHLVFHAAAYKHVPLLEEQPLAAIANNVFATQTLVDSASTHNTRVALLSTDKAVAPASVMGASKRVAELIVFAAGGIVLRLGNVLASRGSVAELFAEQTAAGRSLSVTDPAACRYFITIRESVDLLLAAAAEPRCPALFVPDLQSSHYIVDLARFMVCTLAPDREIPIEFTHLRAGDKEKERLCSEAEFPFGASANGLVRLDSPIPQMDQLQSLLQELRGATESRELMPALSILRKLVPDYTPSHAVLAVSSVLESSVHDE